MNLLSHENPLLGVNLVLFLVVVILGGVIFISVSGFAKYVIVLNLLKNALGTQQIPPNIIVNIIAILLAVNSIKGQLEPGVERLKPYFQTQEVTENTVNFAEVKAESVYDIAKNFDEFFPELVEYAKGKYDNLIASGYIPKEFFNSDETVVETEASKFEYIVGSLISDIIDGFIIGLKFYLVFLTVDFVVAIILTSVGMSMLSPTVISIPLKLAIFFFSGSWNVLIAL